MPLICKAAIIKWFCAYWIGRITSAVGSDWQQEWSDTNFLFHQAEWVAHTGPSCVANLWSQKITFTHMMCLTLVVIILKIRLGFLDRLSCHRAIQSKGSSLPTATPPCTGLRQLASSLPTLTNLDQVWLLNPGFRPLGHTMSNLLLKAIAFLTVI